MQHGLEAELVTCIFPSEWDKEIMRADKLEDVDNKCQENEGAAILLKICAFVHFGRGFKASIICNCHGGYFSFS